jgi:hypothetical protein
VHASGIGGSDEGTPAIVRRVALCKNACGNCVNGIQSKIREGREDALQLVVRSPGAYFV